MKFITNSDRAEKRCASAAYMGEVSRKILGRRPVGRNNMNLQQFAENVQSIGLRVVGSSAFGTWGDFPVAASLNGGGSGNMAIFALAADPQLIKQNRKAVLKPLRTALKGTAVVNIGTDSVNFTIKAKPQTLLQKAQDTQNIALPILHEYGIAPPQTCRLCGQGGCDSYAGVYGGYRPVHARCVQALGEKAEAEYQHNQQNGSYARGILGAILGGLVAAIPNLLTIWFMEVIYSLLYALIPLGAYFGYKKLGGKMNKAGVAVVCLISVVVGLLIDPITVVIAFVSEGLPLSLLPYIFANDEFIAVLMPEILKSLLFVALGIFIVWSKISRTAAHSVLDVQQVVQTLQPMPGVQFEPAQSTLDPAPESAPSDGQNL